MAAYYNEIDPFAAAWLRRLIAAGHIAAGEVDERSITEVSPDDLRGYTQCHFFAGIGGWSYALRLAGVPDSARIWTGSCPCQPFSAAGKQRGSDDERHLWPAFFRLIRECRPPAVFGEQVAGSAGLAWLDHVCADLEGAGYAAAAADLPACSVGAPHRRQRLWWVADAQCRTRQLDGYELAEAQRGTEGSASERQRVRTKSRNGGEPRAVAYPESRECGSSRMDRENGQEESAAVIDRSSGLCAVGDGMGHADDARREGCERPGDVELHRGTEPLRPASAAGVLDHWADLEWLACSDGKARPTQPGLFPLAHGIPGRVGRLRAYGNAIVPQVAAEFIGAYLDTLPFVGRLLT